MVTFPSEKDTAYHKQHPDRVTAQILVLTPAGGNWKEWAEKPTGDRGSEYDAYKKEWERRALDVLQEFYPGFVPDHIDTSTPLSAAHYLNSDKGCAAGLETSPDRFVNDDIGEALDSAPFSGAIRGLWLTGQDQFVCGANMAQISGFATALRIAGPWRTAQFLTRCARLSLREALWWPGEN